MSRIVHDIPLEFLDHVINASMTKDIAETNLVEANNELKAAWRIFSNQPLENGQALLETLGTSPLVIKIRGIYFTFTWNKETGEFISMDFTNIITF